MKKLFYIMIVTLATTFAMSSCTDEEVKPFKQPNTGGGGMLDPL
jgi:hypothetical protein